MTRAGFDSLINDLASTRPVLIAGPTASGKSGLALEIAQRHGGVVVNADASQVYGCWHALTARPSPQDEAAAPHALYGHIAEDAPYSVGHWLREIKDLLDRPERLIIVGGTGLYFQALTTGLADIPAIPEGVRAQANARPLAELVKDLDPQTARGIDLENRARVQRAWEVLKGTGRGLAAWQADTPPPLLPLQDTLPIVLDVARDWLNARIAQRFDQMLAAGALDEAARIEPHYTPSLPAHRAIGARELIAHLRGEMTYEAARTAAIIATRQYAKRQRTWARGRMGPWHALSRP